MGRGPQCTTTRAVGVMRLAGGSDRDTHRKLVQSRLLEISIGYIPHLVVIGYLRPALFSADHSRTQL